MNATPVIFTAEVMGAVDNNFAVGGALNVGSTVGFANDLASRQYRCQ